MDPVIIIAGICIGVFVLMFLGVSIKRPLRWLGQGAIRIMIGALAVFVINLFGNLAGLHLPINLFTSSVTGFLGIPGVLMLFAVHFFVLPV